MFHSPILLALFYFWVAFIQTYGGGSLFYMCFLISLRIIPYLKYNKRTEWTLWLNCCGVGAITCNYIVYSALKRSCWCLGMEENELCKTIKLRNGWCKICVFCIINFKHFMVAWSNFQVNWDQIIVTQNALLSYETKRWNSLHCISSQDIRLAWTSDKTQGDIFLSNLSELLSGNAVAINLVIDNPNYRWRKYLCDCKSVISHFFFPSCSLHWCVLSFIFLQAAA